MSKNSTTSTSNLVILCAFLALAIALVAANVTGPLLIAGTAVLFVALLVTAVRVWTRTVRR